MRKLLFNAGMLLLILNIVVACNQREAPYDQIPISTPTPTLNLHINKPDGQGYAVYKKIEDDETVQTVLDILSNVSWENVKIEMTRRPDYKMLTANIDRAVSYEPITYAIWISPKKNIEVLIEGQSKYGKVIEAESKKLLSILETT